MENLPENTNCPSEDNPLRLDLRARLRGVYESLTSMPQVNEQVTPDVHPSTEGVIQATPKVFGNATGTPRRSARQYHKRLSKSLKRTHGTMDKVEERKRGTKRYIVHPPVEKNKIVDTGDNIDIRLHHDKQNDSTSGHSDAHREICASKISADQSVNSSSSDKTHLDCHILTNRRQKSYECAVCKKCFNYKSRLDEHLRTHKRAIIIISGESGDRSSSDKVTQWSCDYCQKCFIVEDKFKKHVRTKVCKKRKPYKCKVCKKCYAEKSKLNIHTRTHTGEKPYVCNVCSRSFSQKCHLDSHNRTHTSERPFKCNLCEKCYFEKKTLNRHMLKQHSADTSEKPNECHVCKLSFIQKSYLDDHIRTHMVENPYECNVCKKTFTKKVHFNIHMQAHTDEKPYECHVCSKSFHQKCQLYSHNLYQHSSEKPYKCNLCKKCYFFKKTLDRHMRTHTTE